MARAVVASLRDLVRFRGRLARLAYWQATLLLVAIAAVTLTVGYSAIIVVGQVGAVLLIPMLGVLVGGVAIVVRRLHDRNKSAWWVLPFVVWPFLASAWIRESDPAGASLTTLLLALITLVLQVWGLVEIGFLRGTAGPNRYGFDPMQPPPREVFA